jgi:hypothetical protein
MRSRRRRTGPASTWIYVPHSSFLVFSSFLDVYK